MLIGQQLYVNLFGHAVFGVSTVASYISKSSTRMCNFSSILQSHNFITLASTYTGIPGITFFAYAMYYWFSALLLTLTIIPYLFWITLSTIKLTSALIWNMFCKCFTNVLIHLFLLIYQIYIFYFMGIFILPNGSPTVLQLPFHHICLG